MTGRRGLVPPPRGWCRTPLADRGRPKPLSVYPGAAPGTNMTGSVLASTDTLNDWAMYSGEAVYEWFRRKTILLCSFRTVAADLETPAT